MQSPGMPKMTGVTREQPSAEVRANKITSAMRYEVEHWLDWQSRMLSGSLCGGVYLNYSDEKTRNLDTIEWPSLESGKSEVVVSTRAQRLKVAHQVVDSSSNVTLVSSNDRAEETDYIGCTISSGDLTIGAVVFALSHRTESQRVAVLQLVQWCVIWLESKLNASIRTDENTQRLTQSAISIISDDYPLAVSGNALCTLLAETFGYSMVSLGLKRGLQIRLTAVSHRMLFDRRSNSMSLLEVAMEESLDQNKRLMAPSNSTNHETVDYAHQQVLKNSDYAQIVSLPIGYKDGFIGVLTLGRMDDEPAFDQNLLSRLEMFTEEVAPVLVLKQMSETSVSKRFLQTANSFIERLTGQSDYKFKAISLACLCAVILTTTLDTNRVVPATAVIEGETQQAIVAHADSFVQTVGARAGDRVRKGQILATLNTNDLKLEREKWQSELAKREGEHHHAWASKDPAKVTVASSKIRQSKAQLAQIETRIEQSQMLAPFDGYLINGDFSQSIGAPVTRGQVMYEIIPNANYKLVLDVEEHLISEVKIGQIGSLRLNGLPGKRIELVVSDVLPVASTKNGKSVFRVEADVNSAPGDIRPGLHGVAKVIVGQGSYISVWTEQIRRKLRLFFWSAGF